MMKKKYNIVDKSSLKCVLVGDTAVGKSSIAARLSSRNFKTDYFPTIFDNFAATMAVEGKPYHVSLFDTAGQENFNKLRVIAYMKCDVFLICFSVAQPETLKSVQETWVPELRQYIPNIHFVLVGTQIDKRTKTSPQVVTGSFISAKEGSEMAAKLGACYYVECSCSTSEGIDDLKQDIIYTAHRNWQTNCAKPAACCNCQII